MLIDFGLAYTSTLVEDKAVDLYVLERAFSSTHPASEALFASVLKAYEQTMSKEWKEIHRRLEDGKSSLDVDFRVLIQLVSVRLRGRKRSMLG